MEKFGNEIKDFDLGEGSLVRPRDCQNAAKNGLFFGKKLKSISLYGKVVGCEHVGKNNDKISFFLNDGKSEIRCLASLQPDNPTLLAEIKSNWDSLNDIVDKTEEDMACFLLANSTKCLYMEYVSDIEKLKYGDIVRLWGKMRTYRDEEYVYANHIQVISSDEDKIYHQKNYKVVCAILDQYENYLKEQNKNHNNEVADY